MMSSSSRRREKKNIKRRVPRRVSFFLSIQLNLAVINDLVLLKLGLSTHT